ncbi:uncharacterized protein [Maniola hyperantus]|uniref:uncharacterized protein n=1 Tax=Aphantopus hyperantus TaxID=2795564 RepID=UPI00213FE35F
MLELLKNLEGDEGTLVSELIQVLIRTKILVETSFLEMEPDLESLVKTPGMMMGEPHTTFPRIVALIWMLVTDPASNRKYGWCPIQNVNQYLRISKPHEIAKKMRTLELVVARARFIMEEFIQNVTPVNMYQKKTPRHKQKVPHEGLTTQHHAIKQRANEKVHVPHQFGYTHPTSVSERSQPGFEVLDGNEIDVTNACAAVLSNLRFLVPFVFLV